jgi:MinD superfamily P-loop ATPase
MKELVIISGKGGTGKTCLTAAFASLAQNAILCDADVDAADLHLIVEPAVYERHEFWGGHKAEIRKKDCTRCRLCAEVCRFSVITGEFDVDSLSCEGCGVCVRFCPEKAIDFPMKICGEWMLSHTRFGSMVHAQLGIAEDNSGKLVTLIRQKARKLAEETNTELILTDGPPGIGCPVIASIGGASAVLLVTEPTVSGLHDMDRVLDLAEQFRVPAMICVNKSDLNSEMAVQIAAHAEKRRIRFLGNIPFDPLFTRAMIRRQTLFEYDMDSSAKNAVRQIWQELLSDAVQQN